MNSQQEVNVLQINQSKVKMASNILQNKVAKHKIDFVLAKELRDKKEKLYGLSQKWNVISSKNNKAAILTTITSQRIAIIAIKNNTVAIKIQAHQFPITIISAYNSPYDEIQNTLQEIQDIFTSIPTEHVIMGTDLNGRNTIWGYKDNNTRGTAILDFILANNLFIINTQNEPPNFTNNDGRYGWPDLTICSQNLTSEIKE
ncbi:hypothetical protein AVEN_4535-1 [Araneus ventricosus]|uniref:Endonuclease/exonuclease/phosphatase domain-containing protein n=1 Tax=Araneus ventricosus TaxID=182803 RepID=A0A4Y2BM92_ARAVE|nr:hypothetical protein AVEN_4535-1 [Araneus ventricosus]